MRQHQLRETILLLLLMPFLAPAAYAQPDENWRARFESVKNWQVEIHLDYDFVTTIGSSTTKTRAASVWTGILTHEEMWTSTAGLEVLPWNGNLAATVEGEKVIMSGHGCRTTINTQNLSVPHKPFFLIEFRKDEYSFGAGYENVTGLEEVSQCPGKLKQTSPYGGLTFSQPFRVVRPLPQESLNLSGNTTLDHSSLTQVEGASLQPGEKITVTWDFKPVSEYVCGPDVTKATTNTLDEMEDYFIRLSPEKKIAHCEALNALSLQSFGAWDIWHFVSKNAFWLDSYTKDGSCCIPGDGETDENEDSTTCKHSVRHSGRCVLAGTLNYFTYGQMHRLCYNYALESLRNKQLLCVMRLGGCSQPGGLPSPDQIAGYNERCRSETAYPGPPIFPRSQECQYPPKVLGPVLDPAKWDKSAMGTWIKWYKWTRLRHRESPDVPIAFAEAAFDSGSKAVPPVENRAQCTRECDGEAKGKFLWTWCPDHRCEPPILPLPDPR